MAEDYTEDMYNSDVDKQQNEETLSITGDSIDLGRSVEDTDIDAVQFDTPELGARMDPDVPAPGVQITSGASDFPFFGSSECFGVSDNGDGTVQVYNGAAYRRGDLANNPYTDGVTPQGPLNPGTSVPMGANPWLLWKWDSAGTVITYLAAASIPQDTGGVFYGAIAFFTFSGSGSITGMTRYQCGTILDLTAFAPAT